MTDVSIKRKSEDHKPEKEEKQMKVRSENSELQHKQLHTALVNLDLDEVKRLLQLGVQICHEDNFINCCYILAQNIEENPEFLTVLLKYDSSGINTVDSEGNTLLMRDIRDYNCKQAEMLIDLGADVNTSNEDDYTALHYATINEDTSINIIKKLLESTKDIDKRTRNENAFPDHDQDSNEGKSPLHLLLKHFEKSNGLEKVKLLVEAGADLNLEEEDGESRTCLHFAALIDVRQTDFNLIKYLVEKGATPSSSEYNEGPIYLLLNDLSLSAQYLSKEKTVAAVKDYYIPIINLLLETGDNLFLKSDDEYKSPLCMALSAFNSNEHLNELIIHLVTLAFKRLAVENETDYETEVHPLDPILDNLEKIANNKVLFTEIVNLILLYNEKGKLHEYKFHSMCHEENLINWPCMKPVIYEYQYTNIVRSFVHKIPLSEMKMWLIKLKEHNFVFDDDNKLLMILLQKFLKSKRNDFLNEVIDYLLNLSCKVCTTNIKFNCESLRALQIIYEIPDPVWISAAAGNLSVLKRFLPYWDQHPLTVLLFLRPWLETNEQNELVMLNSIANILPFLINLGDPLNQDSDLYCMLKDYLEIVSEQKYKKFSRISFRSGYEKIILKLNHVITM